MVTPVTISIYTRVLRNRRLTVKCAAKRVGDALTICVPEDIEIKADEIISIEKWEDKVCQTCSRYPCTCGGFKGETNMTYKENPKTRGSGILCAIPQTGECPVGCEDCFFQSGRSFLEPLSKNLPNMPPENTGCVIRVNDGNDSCVDQDNVVLLTEKYPMRFFNTSFVYLAHSLPGPVVVTVNPGAMTDKRFHQIDDIPRNLMFVRVRTNTWNLDLVDDAIEYYSECKIPVVLTFMAYFRGMIPDGHKDNYIYRTRVLNSYWTITTQAWENVMRPHRYNKWVSSCGKIEGEKGTTSCRHCGNCLREYFATRERLR